MNSDGTKKLSILSKPATSERQSKMPLLYADDFAELSAAWSNRYNDLFQKKVTEQFVSDLIDHAVKKDFKAEFLQQINHLAHEPKDLWVSLGIYFPKDTYFTAEGFGQKRMTIKQILYRTDALQQIAAFIGKDIKVRPMFDDDVIFIRVEYWPRRVVVANGWCPECDMYTVVLPNICSRCQQKRDEAEYEIWCGVPEPQ